MSDRPTVLVALRPSGEPPPRLAEKAGELADLVLVREAGELGADAAGARAAFVWNFRSTLVPDAIDRLPALEWVHVAASGIDASLSDAVRRRAPVFTNSRGVTAEAMAEYALALLLALAKDLPERFRDQRAERWAPALSRMLAGTCLVAVGVGAVNRALARKASALGMRVIGVGRTAHAPADGFERIDGRAGLGDALAEADHVVVATPLTGETRGLVGAAELARLRPGALLVNIGRGPVIDEPALLDALESGRLGGAGLDVFAHEPLAPGHPLWTLPNVLVSPHMASDFAGWEDAMVDLFAANLRRYVAGEPLVNVIDKEAGY